MKPHTPVGGVWKDAGHALEADEPHRWVIIGPHDSIIAFHQHHAAAYRQPRAQAEHGLLESAAETADGTSGERGEPVAH